MLDASVDELRKLRWSTSAVVVQSALSALNPVHTIERHFEETVQAHPNSEATPATELLEMVELEPDAWPLSTSAVGWQRQRVVIALALMFRPCLLLFDEPTTALDALIEEEILAQFLHLQAELGFAGLFVTHDP